MSKIFLILLVTGFAEWANGHHSNDYHFDSDISVTVEGTVRAFRFVSPHARLVLDVVDEDGEIEAWDCELAAAVGLRRRGWTQDIFQSGEEIVIRGFAARRSDTECYFQTAEFSDGRRIAMTDTFDREPQASVRAVTPRFSNPNIPNFSRVWRRARISSPGGGMGPGGGPRLGGPNPQAWVLSEQGRRVLESYDPVLDDPALTCSPVSIRRLWGNNDLTLIEQTGNLVTITHEWMDAVRYVHLNTDGHLVGLERRGLGHSIGWYEGLALVIDTIGFEAGMLAQHPGLPHSDQLHVVERLVLDETGDSFELTMVFEDALYFTDQLTETRMFEVSDEMPQRYNCTH